MSLKTLSNTPTVPLRSSWPPNLPRYPNIREVAAGPATMFPGSSYGLERLLDSQVPGEIQFGEKSVLCPAVAGFGALGSHAQTTATQPV
jgi:hypothetical protein